MNDIEARHGVGRPEARCAPYVKGDGVMDSLPIGDELGGDYDEMVDRMEAGELGDEDDGEDGAFGDAPLD